MPVLRLDNVTHAYGHHALLDQVNLEIRRHERVCLVGRNGAGKSSLMRLINRSNMPDAGSVWLRPGTCIAHVDQQETLATDATVFACVAGGLAHAGQALTDYHQAKRELASMPSAGATQRVAKAQQEVEAADGWRSEQKIKTILSRLDLNADAPVNTLSGGWQRRVLLARALVDEPELLLLDEPTNHLDIAAITWLEDFLLDYSGTTLFISHDRAFVRRLATRIIELDRGRLTSWSESYDDYVRRKTEQLAVEVRHHALFDKKLAQEETWIRQGIKARRTRNEGRVRALEALRVQRQQRRSQPGTVNLSLDAGASSGHLVIEAEHLHYDYGDKTIIRDFSARIMRGDRIGIIGPNGAGKSTLIKLLLGELTAHSGRLQHGTHVQIAYFDQQRSKLDPAARVIDCIGGKHTITFAGRERHVAGYLRDFLFPPERLHSPVSALSGGERNRLLLAQLFAQPANLLVLDEPTNDLDVETLELLEELLLAYTGTMLLVSHDRAFLDNAVTSILVFTEDGRIVEHVGGYSDWQRHREAIAAEASVKPRIPAADAPRSSRPTSEKTRKLSYKDQYELTALPQKIETLEHAQARLLAQVNAAAFYRQPQNVIASTLSELEAVNQALETSYQRWQTLESQAGMTAG